MSFLAACVFCGHKVQAPDHALGASGRCPKCANYFTLAPERAMPAAAAFLRARAGHRDGPHQSEPPPLAVQAPPDPEPPPESPEPDAAVTTPTPPAEPPAL